MAIHRIHFHFTLIDFHNEVIEVRDTYFINHTSAIAGAFDLFYARESCARVIIESDWGFHVTIEWGVRRSY